MVFPFEENPITKGLWWELDRARQRWRTIGRGLGDPEYDEQDVSAGKISRDEDVDRETTQRAISFTKDAVKQVSDDNDDDLSAGMASLSIAPQPIDMEKIVSKGHCALNAVSEFLENLGCFADTRDIVGSAGGKAVLQEANEKAQVEREELLAALRCSQVCLARMLIAPGADVTLIGWHEAQVCAELEGQNNLKLYGKTQVNRPVEKNAIENELIISEIFSRISSTGLSKSWKTVACLRRGSAFPHTLSVSGYSPGSCGVGGGALDRRLWTEKVFQLANVLGYHLPEDRRDKGRPGLFNACHAEKQLLAFVLWSHTTALEDIEAIEGLKDCAAPSLSRLPVDIFIWQPRRETTEICKDCQQFCDKAARIFDLTLRLFVIRGRGVSVELRRSWP